MLKKSFRHLAVAAILSLPIVSLSAYSALTQTEPAQTEPAQTEPAQTEPAQTEPAQTEPAQTKPVTFTLKNGTRRVLEEFYASPPGVDDWEEDILGVDVLAPGEEVEITIDDGREDCKYDFKGVLGPSEDESVGRGELIQSAVEVCNGGTYEYFEK